MRMAGGTCSAGNQNASSSSSLIPSLLSTAAGLTADGIFADVHGPQKAAVLADLGAAVYVGDTPADMAAAAEAGARAIGVSTGSFTDRDLKAAGADLVLSSLADFPALYGALDV